MVLRLRKSSFYALIGATVYAGTMVGLPVQAQAAKVHWKENPASPGCFALAFDDTNQWFATANGSAFKMGVCHGHPITYEIDLAQDRESFTVKGAHTCDFEVGDKDVISVTCRGINGH